MTHRTAAGIIGLWLAAVVSLGVAARPAAAQPVAEAPTREAPLIPRTVLFGNPERTRPQLSPDGTRLAYLAPVDGVLNVWVGPVGGDATPITHDTDRGIRRYAFAFDSRHVLYLQDAGGDENWRLYGVDLETGALKDYTPFPDVQVRLHGLVKRRPDEVLIAMNKENINQHDVYRLNLKTGEMAMVAKNPGSVAGWYIDPELHVLGSARVTATGGLECRVRTSEDAEWTILVEWSLEDNAASGPLVFTDGGRALILKDSRGTDTARLVRWDLITGEQTVLLHDDTYDVAGGFHDLDTFEVQAAGIARERREWVAFDEQLRADLEAMERIAPGELGVIGRDNAEHTWLLQFTRDTASASYYLYHRPTGRTKYLFDSQPALNAYTLAPMESIQLPARDGLTLRGYITFPVGRARRGLPMVLLVHGGPWTRQIWGFHSTAQWLANRGYVCVQINYRGSTGYGKAFLNAGNREWGGAMHDDLVDTVQWAVAQGYADPARVGIMGASYGGYAALVGATFTPDLFACAVSVVGPSSLGTLLKSVPPYWAPMGALWRTRVGDPETEAAFLRSRSPLYKVDQITIPILIAQGANDPRVKQAESEQIVAAMKERGIAHEYLLFPDEGHGFAKPENQLRYAAAAERFLAQHLGGRFEPEAAP